MTNAAPLLPFGDPQPRTLSDVHTDLSREMARLHREAPELYTKAHGFFKEQQDARTDAEAAEQLLTDVLALSVPANLPFQPAPQATATPVPAPTLAEAADDTDPPEDMDTSENESDPDAMREDGPEDADGDSGDLTFAPTEESETSSDAAPDTTPDAADLNATLDAPLTPTPVQWPDGTLGAGLISQLAATLAAGDMLSLVLTRVGDQLLVTVQPAPLKGEPASTAQPLQAKGTPAALDTRMVPELDAYRQGREIARSVVNYAEQVKAAGEAHRKAVADAARKTAKPASAKAGASTASTASGQLTVEISPKDAVLVLQDAGGKTHAFQCGKTTALPAGEYTLSIDAEGYDARTETLSVKAGKPTKTAFVLRKQSVPGLF